MRPPKSRSPVPVAPDGLPPLPAPRSPHPPPFAALAGSLLLVVALLATGCASVPPVEPPELPVEVPADWTAVPGATRDAPPEDAWWRDLAREPAAGDRLESLVAEALSRNTDLAAAAARVEAAAAQARIAGADALPQVNGRFDASRRRQNFLGFPIPGSDQQVLSTTTTSLQAALNVSWELDLWGRLRAAEEAALAQAQASVADLWGARLSLAGQTAKGWFAVLEADEQLDLALETLENRRFTEERIRRRYELGLRPPLDLRLAIANRANAEADVAQRRRQRDAALRRLELLLGRYPDGDLATGAPPPTAAAAQPGDPPEPILASLHEPVAVAPDELPPLPDPWREEPPATPSSPPGVETMPEETALEETGLEETGIEETGLEETGLGSLGAPALAPVPAGLPAQLLARRPDLVAAERRLAAAGLSLEEARASLLPRISLTGSAGRSSQDLEDLLDNDFTVWSLAAGLLQPIFQGGRLRAAVDLAEAQRREVLARYVTAALQAFAEVEQALAAERLLADRVAALAEAAKAARGARELALQRYGAGLESYLTVLETERQVLLSEVQLISARRERLDTRVDLHLALGGGFGSLEDGAARGPGAAPDSESDSDPDPDPDPDRRDPPADDPPSTTVESGR